MSPGPPIAGDAAWAAALARAREARVVLVLEASDTGKRSAPLAKCSEVKV